MKLGETRVCPACAKSFYAQRSEIKRGFGVYCSHRCGNLTRGNLGQSNGNWKHGRYAGTTSQEVVTCES